MVNKELKTITGSTLLNAYVSRTNSQLYNINRSHLPHCQKTHLKSRLRGVIPKQSAFERLLFKTRELEQNSALQLNELKKFNKKWRDLKFAEPRPQHFENNYGTSLYAILFSNSF